MFGLLNRRTLSVALGHLARDEQVCQLTETEFKNVKYTYANGLGIFLAENSARE